MSGDEEKTKKGFTIIEVMLVLAITGLLLVGTLSGGFGSIRVQRYNDSVQSFAEDLRQVYNEALNPRSNHDGGNKDRAIYGKIIAFGASDVTDPEEKYGSFATATLVGTIATTEAAKKAEQALKFLDAIKTFEINCDTVDERHTSWGTMINKNRNDGFTGVVIIARSPSSGTMHTVVSEGTTLELTNGACDANEGWLKEGGGGHDVVFDRTSATNFCLKSEDATVLRAVQLLPDGSNSSAVKLLSEDEAISVECY